MHACVCVCVLCVLCVCVCVCVCARSQPWQKHKQEGLHRKRQEVVKRFDIDRQRQQVRVPARVVNVIFNLCACACAADVVRMSVHLCRANHEHADAAASSSLGMPPFSAC